MRPLPRVLTGLLAAFLIAACGGGDAGTALGDASPPPNLDPASPTLAAKDIAFTTANLQVPAGKPFVLVFENREGVMHNVSIYEGTAGTNRLFEGVSFAGPATRWYPVPALAAGDYVFKCDLHPTMTGSLHAS
jgi:plastocyanin